MEFIDASIKLIKLVMFMIFISSIGAQGWIAFLDISKYFTDELEKFRPERAHDKYSRFAIIIGVFAILLN
jgi:hypothetical protein